MTVLIVFLVYLVLFVRFCFELYTQLKNIGFWDLDKEKDEEKDCP